jgi:GntR family transcriptional regulator
VTAETKLYEIASRLDPSSRVPLYEQLAQLIHQAITNNELEPGTLVPREQELAARLGLSRQTVNQALSSLARRGLVTRRRGVGTFIADAYIEQPLGHLYSFLRTLIAQGRYPTTEVLGYRVTVDERASAALTGQANGLLFELQRLRLVDGAPLAVETVYLPRECGQSLPLDRVAAEPLYDLIQEVCGLRVTNADETLRPINVEEPEASLLGLPVGEAAFLVERTGYAGDQAIELRRSIIRGDRFRFRVTLTGLDQPRSD